MDIICPKCGTLNKDASRFCARCGEDLPHDGESAQENATPHESARSLDLPWLQTVQDRAVKQTGRLAEPQANKTPEPPPALSPSAASTPAQRQPEDVHILAPEAALPSSQQQEDEPSIDADPSKPTGDPNEPPPGWVLGILEPDATPTPNPDQPYEPEELAHIMPWAHPQPGTEQPPTPEDTTSPGLPPWLSGVTVQETLATSTASPDKTVDPIDLGIDDIEPFMPPEVAEQPTEEGAADIAPAQVPEWLRSLSSTRDKAEQAAQLSSQTNLHEVPVQAPEPEIVAEPVARHTPVRPPRAGAVETLFALVQPLTVDTTQPGVRIPSTITSLDLRAQKARSRPLDWLLPDGIIYIAILAVLLSVLLIRPPFGDVTAPAAPGAQEFYSAIKDSPSDKPVLVVYDWDATRSAEMSVLSQAVMRQLMSSRRRFVTISTNPQGPGFAEQITRNARERYGYVYERDYLVLGYLPGNEAALNALVNNFNQSLPRDYIYNRNVNGSRLIGGGQLRGIDSFGLIIALTSEEAELRNLIEQVGTRTNVPIVAAVPQGLEPLARPYLQVQHAGIKAILSGLTGALQYNRQLDLQYGATAQPSGTLSLTDRLNTQSVAQLLLALIILAGLVRIGMKKILRR